MRIIGPPLTPEETASLLAFARSQIGVKFKHMGRADGKRLDCLGLVVRALENIGRNPEDSRAYGREPHMDGLEAGVEANLGPPISDPLRPGDVLLMRFAGEPCHVALVGDYRHGGLSLIHTSSAFQKVIEHVLDDAWKARIVKAFRP